MKIQRNRSIVLINYRFLFQGLILGIPNPYSNNMWFLWGPCSWFSTVWDLSIKNGSVWGTKTAQTMKTAVNFHWTYRSFFNDIFWRGPSNGPRFPRRGGGAPSKVGVPTYYLAQFLPKTAWKWKNLDPERGRASLAPPLRSANGTTKESYSTAFEQLRYWLKQK